MSAKGKHGGGEKQGKKKGGKLKVILIVFAALVALGAIGGAMGGGTHGAKSQTTQGQPSASEGQSSGSDQSQQTAQKQDEDDSVPAEYKNALAKAKQYNDTVHLSKAKLYDQLTSEYADKFSKEAAQYAVAKILSGEANVTLKTVAELDAALGLGLRLSSNGEVSRSQVAANWMRAAVATESRMGHDWMGGNQSRRIVNKPVNLTCFDGGMAA